MVEHPEVITLGRRRESRANVVEARFPIVEVERGGDVTYHGPGQLVGYPILALAGEERDLHRFLRAIEQALIDLCATLGVAAGRRDGATGVWLGEKKVASIGIAVRRWVTLHGFAINISTDLSHFSAIRPCGFAAEVMTSLSESLRRPVALDEVKGRAIYELGRRLGRRFMA